MSYVVHVWETQIPTSLADAIQIRASFSSMNKTSPLVFAKLAKQIRQTLQQECSAGEDELWPEGCPDGKSVGAVYSLGLDAEYLEYVLPVLIREAGALQLIVLDEQAGAVYLPDGSHFTVAGRYQTEFAPPEPPGEQLTERQQLIDALNEQLAPIMAPQGFKSLKRWSDTYAPHKRNGKACNQILFFDMRSVGSKGIPFDVQFMNEVKFPPQVKAAWGLSGNFSTLSLNFDLIAIAKAAGKPDMKGLHYTDRHLVATRSEVRTWIDEFRGLLDGFVLPAANRCQTYDGLDALLNGEQHDGLPLTRGYPDLQILMAYMANNSNLEVITETALAAVPDHRRESVAGKVAALMALPR